MYVAAYDSDSVNNTLIIGFGSCGIRHSHRRISSWFEWMLMWVVLLYILFIPVPDHWQNHSSFRVSYDRTSCEVGVFFLGTPIPAELAYGQNLYVHHSYSRWLECLSKSKVITTRGDKNKPPTPNICESSPQQLLDDLINIANNTVQNGVNGLEEFLRWWGLP